MGQSPPTPRTHHVVLAHTLFFSRSLSLFLSYTHSRFLSRSLLRKFVSVSPVCRSPSFVEELGLLESFSPSSLAILQFHVLPYGNIVIFPRAVHFCAPPRALRSFRPIWIRAPRDLELEITQVRRHPDGCLRDLGRPASRSGIAARARYSRRDRERNSSSSERLRRGSDDWTGRDGIYVYM